MPREGTIPLLTPLANGEFVRVSSDNATVDSNNPDTMVLTPLVTSAGEPDIDLLYEVNARPANRIHVLAMRLSSGNPIVEDSDLIHVILSPDGENAIDKLHHASLYLEQNISSAVIVPEPTSATTFVTFLLVLAWRRKIRLN